MEIIRTKNRKTCTGCGQIKFKSEFYRMSNHKNFPDGYDCRCKECRRKENRERHRKKPDGLYSINGRTMQREGRVLRIYWGEEAIKKFKRLFPTTTNEELAIEFLCSERTIIRRARKLGLEKDPEWMAANWEINRKLTYRNPNRDYTTQIECLKKYRFKKGVGNDKLSSKQRSEAAKKAWVTKRRNMRRKLNST